MGIQPGFDFLFGEGAFSGPADTESVHQGEQIVQRRVNASRPWHAAIERLNRFAPDLSFRVRPDGLDLIGRIEFMRHNGRGPGRRHSTSNGSDTGRKCMGYAIHEKFAESVTPNVLCIRNDQVRFDEPTYGGMYFRRAHSKGFAQVRVALPRRT
jgi:hypothetical protein